MTFASPSRRLRAMAAGLGALTLGGCTLNPGRVAYVIESPDARPASVGTQAGVVQGVETSAARVFLGVPFAAPPVGPRRFQPPAPVQPWGGVLKATRAGPMCIQRALPGERQSEDCLKLNVYEPAGPPPAAGRPVMVWFYGGGFELGADTQYDPLKLAVDQGVVVVAPNYRLGALGFLAHPALKGPGEGAYALLDQQAALRWVRDNISAFGGDPANVTIFGESAGGWSVCYQLVAPGAKGLFRRAIVESGACTSPESAIALPDAERGGEAMAADLGCGGAADAAACLRGLPASAFRAPKARRRGLLGKDSWSAAFGGDVLPESPRAALEAGRFAAVPVIDGTNRDEGRLFLEFARWGGKLRTRASYEKIIGDFFGPHTPEVLAEYADEAKRSYGLAYADVVTDATFACSALTLNRLLQRRTNVYAYEFDDPNAPFSLPRPPFTPPPRAYHSSELVYVFERPWVLANPDVFTPAQTALANAMQAAWGSFATRGDPNGPGAASWPVNDGATPLRLSPTESAPADDFADVHRCAFWSRIGY